MQKLPVACEYFEAKLTNIVLRGPRFNRVHLILMVSVFETAVGKNSCFEHFTTLLSNFFKKQRKTHYEVRASGRVSTFECHRPCVMQTAVTLRFPQLPTNRNRKYTALFRTTKKTWKRQVEEEIRVLTDTDIGLCQYDALNRLKGKKGLKLFTRLLGGYLRIG